MTSARPWVLVTGASGALGAAIARAFASTHHVVAQYRSSLAVIDHLRADIDAQGGTTDSVRFDVTDGEECTQALKACMARLGAPHTVVHGAGIVADDLLVFTRRETWNALIDTNLTGFYNVIKPCLKPMLLARRGRIVVLTSTAGIAGNKGQVAYSASKAGLIGATRSLALEVATRGITVNAVAPGFIESEMTQGLPRDTIVPRIPVGRFGRPEEVAAVVRFLSSDAAAYITGQTIPVNGGLTT